MGKGVTQERGGHSAPLGGGDDVSRPALRIKANKSLRPPPGLRHVYHEAVAALRRARRAEPQAHASHEGSGRGRGGRN